MSLADRLREQHRLQILLALKEDPREQSEQTLQVVLKYVGYGITRDRLRTELSWLHEQGLIEIDRRAAQDGELWIATLRNRGLEAAEGHSTPGVARPGLS